MLKQAPAILRIGRHSDGHFYNVEHSGTLLDLLIDQMFLGQEAKDIRKATLFIKPTASLYMPPQDMAALGIDLMIEKELDSLTTAVFGTILRLFWYAEPRRTIWVVSE